MCVRIDRFSRNLYDAMEMQLRLKNLGIDLRFIDRNYETGNPEDLIMKVIDMAIAQVYNERLSLNTTKGMRQAMREGRWMGKAPIGFFNDKETKKVFINPAVAKYVIRAYELMATGQYFAEDIRHMIKREGFYFTKQKFLNMLRNPFYKGFIVIKPYRNEPELIIKGIHEPLVSEELFNRVQWVFNSRKKANGFNKTNTEAFPLRGMLECPVCHRFLTASFSKSRNGSKHPYYHCQTKYDCTHRVRASLIHDKLEEYLDSFRIAPEVKKLYRLVLEKKFNSVNNQKDIDLKKIKKELNEVTIKLNSLNDKFIADQIDASTYSSKKKELDDLLLQLKDRETQINSQETDFNIYIKKGITLVDNLREFYHKASLEVKQKIIGSIFPQNLTFNENEYRTSPLNEAFRLITKTINDLQGYKIQNATVSGDVLNLALLLDESCSQFFEW